MDGEVEEEANHEIMEHGEVVTEQGFEIVMQDDIKVEELDQEEGVLEVDRPVVEVNMEDPDPELTIVEEEVGEEEVVEMEETALEVDPTVQIRKGDSQLTNMDLISKQPLPCFSKKRCRSPNLPQRILKKTWISDLHKGIKTVGTEIWRRSLWPCRYCKSSFTSKNDQVNHIRAEHSCKEEYCPNCGKRFSTKDNMKNHMKKVNCFKVSHVLPPSNLKVKNSEKKVLGGGEEALTDASLEAGTKKVLRLKPIIELLEQQDSDISPVNQISSIGSKTSFPVKKSCPNTLHAATDPMQSSQLAPRLPRRTHLSGSLAAAAALACHQNNQEKLSPKKPMRNIFMNIKALEQQSLTRKIAPTSIELKESDTTKEVQPGITMYSQNGTKAQSDCYARNTDLEVEKVLGRRMVYEEVQYQVKWEGSDGKNITWEAERELSCAGKILEFEKKLPAEERRSTKSSSECEKS